MSEEVVCLGNLSLNQQLDRYWPFIASQTTTSNRPNSLCRIYQHVFSYIPGNRIPFRLWVLQMKGLLAAGYSWGLYVYDDGRK